MLTLSKAIVDYNVDSELSEYIGDNLYNTRAPSNITDNYVVFSFVGGLTDHCWKDSTPFTMENHIIQFNIYSAEDTVESAARIMRHLVNTFDHAQINWLASEYKYRRAWFTRLTTPRVLDLQDEYNVSVDYLVELK